MGLGREVRHTGPLVAATLDAGLVLTSVIVGAALRFGEPTPLAAWNHRVLPGAVAYAAIVVTCLYYWRFYDPFSMLSRVELVTNGLEAMGAATVGLAGVTYAVPELTIGRGILLIATPVALTLVLGWRLGLAAATRAAEFHEKMLILGTGSVARAVAREVLARPRLGLRIHGFIDDDPRLQGRSIVNPRVVGTTADLPAVVREARIGRVVVALSERRGCLPVDVLLDLKIGGTRVSDAASFYEAVAGKILVEDLRPSWLVFSDGFRPGATTRLAKRIVDFLAASIGLAVAAPLMAVVAVLVRWESPGPALFRQDRVGEGGRIFTLYKFRSMRADAESGTGPVWAARNDPRVTRIGFWLRKLRLDELPQLWNVVAGDMSFVGPRPERPHFVGQLSRDIPFYSQRHSIKPGVTGWAQVRYPYGNTVEDALEKLQYDLYYIKHMSLAFDLAIMLQTVKVILLGRGSV